jgi:RpiR family carbohydrate utilization transcriptional regulator
MDQSRRIRCVVHPQKRHCDIGLIVETLENSDIYTPTISRIAGLVLIDILATGVALRREAAQDARLSQMKRISL